MVNSVSSSSFPVSQEPRVPTQELSQEDFYEILVTQISNQDPLNTVDSNAFMENFMTMANFDAIQKMGDQFGVLYQQQQHMWAKDLIGSEVKLLNEDKEEVSGQVTSARVWNNKVLITVGDKEYEASAIQAITQADEAESE